MFTIGIFSVKTNRTRFDKQIAELEQAINNQTLQIEANPTDAMGYYKRAMLYREQGEHQKAIADFTKVIELEPENREAYKYRALTHAYLGNSSQCSKDYAKLIAIDQNQSTQ